MAVGWDWALIKGGLVMLDVPDVAFIGLGNPNYALNWSIKMAHFQQTDEKVKLA